MTCEAQRGISHADVLHLFLAMLIAGCILIGLSASFEVQMLGGIV